MLVLAWYHGDRGEQRVRRTELAILTLLFLLGGGIFWRYQHTTESQTPTAANAPATTKPPTAADAGPSIAVLPFDNRSRVEEDAFFVDGIHDDILTQLSKISALKVISRTSVEQFRDTKLPIKNIAEQLGVKSILEGGVQRAGERVRINVQLIDASTDAHLWADSYDRELTAANIFAIQSEVAAAIAAALSTALTPAEVTSVNTIPTRSLAAWEAYQIGRQRQATRASASLADAEKFFQLAIDLDPDFALAYSGQSDTLMLQIGWAGAPAAANIARAEKLVRKAMDLDRNLAEAWASSGLVANMREQYDSAEPLLRRAIELNPNYGPAYMWLSTTLAARGRLEEALVYSQKDLDLDPLSPAANFDVARSLMDVGRFDEAADRYRKVIDLQPSRPNAYRDLAMLNAYARNDFVAAIPFAAKVVALDPNAPYASCNLASLYEDLGEFALATQVLDRARKRMPKSAGVLACLAWLRLSLSDADAATQLARQALDLDPDSGSARGVLGEIDIRRGDYAGARSYYATESPELVDRELPEISGWNLGAALDLVFILRKTGESERANQLLERSELLVTNMPRLGENGFGIADVQIHALRGEKAKALAALREAATAGWRSGWRYYRDRDPNLASIRNEPEFKAVFADIDRDMAHQRAELAARPKDAPLDLGESRK